MKPPTEKKDSKNQTDTQQVTANCVLAFDPQEFAHYLADMDLTPEQQDELIRVTANTMMAFVDMGFGITPMQTASDLSHCAQDNNLLGKFPLSDDDLLYLEDPNNEFFDDCAADSYAATGDDS